MYVRGYLQGGENGRVVTIVEAITTRNQNALYDWSPYKK
jgi:hypothetical protein